MSLIDRIQAKGPKKILALDGGGIRGMMTVEVLSGIEALLRKEQGWSLTNSTGRQERTKYSSSPSARAQVL
jgi:hypothetical protein